MITWWVLLVIVPSSQLLAFVMSVGHPDGRSWGIPCQRRGTRSWGTRPPLPRRPLRPSGPWRWPRHPCWAPGQGDQERKTRYVLHVSHLIYIFPSQYFEKIDLMYIFPSESSDKSDLMYIFALYFYSKIVDRRHQLLFFWYFWQPTATRWPHVGWATMSGP